MDTGILLNIIDDLIKDENAYGIQTKLGQLKTYLTQSKTQATKVSDSISKTIYEIKKGLKSGNYERFTNGYFKAIEDMGGTKYVGDAMIEEIDKIFTQSKYSIDNQVKKLNSLINSRKTFIDNITNVKDSLGKINFYAHYFTDATYQIGIIIPDKDDLHYAKYLETAIHNWNLIIKALRELTGAEVQDIKIERVNNGCIELIIEVVFRVAESLGDIVLKLVNTYFVIEKIRKHVKGLKDEGVDEKQLKPIEDSQQNKINEEIEKIIEEIIEKHKAEGVEEGRLNELRTQLKKGIEYIAKSLDKGVQVEILPPYVSRDEEKSSEGDTPEQIAEKKKLKTENDKLEKNVNAIKDIGKVLKNTGQLQTDIFKLLKGGEGKIDEE